MEIIRDAGIHVVTTMNVQHLESVSEAVATITGAPVNERLPDEVLLTADEIELVDMSPHALRQLPHREVGGLQRLRERPLVDRLIERLPDVELHVVGAGGGKG